MRFKSLFYFILFFPYASFLIIDGISFMAKDEDDISVQKLTEVPVTSLKKLTRPLPN